MGTSTFTKITGFMPMNDKQKEKRIWLNQYYNFRKCLVKPNLAIQLIKDYSIASYIFTFDILYYSIR